MITHTGVQITVTTPSITLAFIRFCFALLVTKAFLNEERLRLKKMFEEVFSAHGGALRESAHSRDGNH
jgi:hypothetical protein